MIRGKKIVLRPLEEDDLDFCQSLYNDPHIRNMVVGWDFPVSKKKQKIWFDSLLNDKFNVRFIVESKDAGLIGLTGFWDIDWHNRNALMAVKLLTARKTKGKGYGRDVIMTMSAFAFFNMGLHKLWCEILDYNVPSLKCYVEKSGWKIEGKLRKHIFRNGLFHDLYYLGCLKEDFLAIADSSEYVPPGVPAGMKRVNREIRL